MFLFFFEPRTILLGCLFLLTVLISAFSLSSIALSAFSSLFYIIISVVAVLFLLPLPLYFLTFCFIVLKSNHTLIKREGLHLKNLLSIVFIVTLVLSIFVLPPIRVVITNVYLAIVLDLAISISYYSIGLFIVYYVSSKMNEYSIIKKTDVIIVLGSGLINDQVPPLLAQRIRKGVHYYHKLKHKPIMIFSGGKGDDESISEAQAMSDYALTLDVNPSHILLEDQSLNTYQNLLYSKKLFNKKDHVLIVTSNFHVFRALLLSRKLKIKAKGRGSRTKFYYWMNAFIREFVAFLKNTYIFQILAFSFFLIIIIFSSIINYTNIM